MFVVFCCCCVLGFCLFVFFFFFFGIILFLFFFLLRFRKWLHYLGELSELVRADILTGNKEVDSITMVRKSSTVFSSRAPLSLSLSLSRNAGRSKSMSRFACNRFSHPSANQRGHSQAARAARVTWTRPFILTGCGAKQLLFSSSFSLCHEQLVRTTWQSVLALTRADIGTAACRGMPQADTLSPMQSQSVRQLVCFLLICKFYFFFYLRVLLQFALLFLSMHILPPSALQKRTKGRTS